MRNAEWIWVGNEKRDLHAEFVCSFPCQSVGDPVWLRISCDGNYTVKLNGAEVGSGQMSDYENYKLCNEYSLNGFLKEGLNELSICVWHIGVDTVNYRAERPGVRFEVENSSGVIARSGRDTQSRIISGYQIEYLRKIAQVGITSLYDFRKEECGFQDSVLSPKQVCFARERVENLKLLPEVVGKTVVREENRVLVDLGCEYYGYINFKVQSRTSGNPFTVFFGEHILPDGKLLRDLSVCHFGLDFIAEKGENEYRDRFRPIGCRYLEIVSEDPVVVERLTFTPMAYDFHEKEFHLSDETDEKIYRTCIHTLKCCANIHYIDCPWREQGMYVLDSRNQMLCGYYAFGEYALPRFNLIFLSKGMTEFGLLSSCPPSPQKEFIIPFFSLIYVVQVCEYVEHSGDVGVIGEIKPALDEIIRTFLKAMEKKPLIPRFPRTHFWNFYEWTAGSDGNLCEEEEGKECVSYDLILNCAFVMAIEKYRFLLGKIGEEFDFPLNEYRSKIKEVFYEEKKRLFRLNSRTHEYSRLGCSMAILAAIVTGEEAKGVAESMIHADITDCSLSCAGFYYDALLKASEDYKEFILSDIRKKYKYMLDKGATTFWETLNGSAENGGIGSLCHGWSALPIYYYHKFFDAKQL